MTAENELTSTPDNAEQGGEQHIVQESATEEIITSADVPEAEHDDDSVSAENDAAVDTEDETTEAAAAEQPAEDAAGQAVEPEPEAEAEPEIPAADPLMLIFQAPDLSAVQPVPARRRRQDDDRAEDRADENERDEDRQDSSSGADGDDTDDSGENEGQQRSGGRSRSRRRRQRGRGTDGSGANRQDEDTASDGSDGSARSETDEDDQDQHDGDSAEGTGEANGSAGSVSRRRRRRRRGDADMELEGGSDGDPENTVTRVRAPRQSTTTGPEGVTSLKGSTRLEAKKQRRRESRQGNRRRHVITEAEFLARRESVDRRMLVRQREHRIQIAVMEDGVLAEHFVSNTTQDSLIGNVYLGKVQNVLPSMEAAFVDIGRGRNAVLYAGEVNWDAAQLDGKPKKIENALKSGDSVLVQVTKDPVGHKGARLTSQISLPGRYLVYVPGGSMTGISRKLPDVERSRLKKILKDHLPENAGVIVRTAAEGTSEQELMNDINRLRAQWEGIEASSTSTKVLAPELLYSEPDLTIKVVRDVFNEDFSGMVVQGEEVWDSIEAYVTYVAPHLLDRVEQWKPEDHDGDDLFAEHRIDEQLHKALERKVYLPSGGSLVIDRTEAMTVVDVNTGKFTGSGGNLEETVTKNNLEAAEEIVRQLRLRDIGGIIVIDFIDMVLESNRDLVLRRLVECLGRDRTKHQVAEVTSLGLVQMTRKRMGTGLVEIFSETCEHCNGRGIIVHDMPVEHRRAHNSQGEPRQNQSSGGSENDGQRKSSRSERRRRNRERQAERNQTEQNGAETTAPTLTPEEEAERQARADAARAAFATIAAATTHHADENSTPAEAEKGEADAVDAEAVVTADAAETAAPAQDAPAETVETVESAAPEQDAPSTGGSSRSGRRRSRRASSGETSPQHGAPEAAAVKETTATTSGTSSEPVAEQSGTDSVVPTGPQVLTLGGEPVAVPHGSAQGRDRSRGRDASADLSRLEQALDSRQPAELAAETTTSAAPTRRRRRAASSDGHGGEIRSVEVTEGSAQGATFSARAEQATAPADASSKAPAAPVMLGVGVKAEDIARPE